MGVFAQARYAWYGIEQAFFAPKPKFSTDQIPDLAGRVAVVTGASQVLCAASEQPACLLLNAVVVTQVARAVWGRRLLRCVGEALSICRPGR